MPARVDVSKCVRSVFSGCRIVPLPQGVFCVNMTQIHMQVQVNDRLSLPFRVPWEASRNLQIAAGLSRPTVHPSQSTPHCTALVRFSPSTQILRFV